jgi:hypothetical protein
MSKNEEQSNDQSSNEKDDFNSLSLEQMREAINKEAETKESEDQDQQNSEENQEENSNDQETDGEQSSEGESSEDNSDSSDSEKSDDQSDKQNQGKPEPVSREEYEKLQKALSEKDKSYKALQREFTKRNQARTKETEKPASQSEKKSVIDQIRSKNPDAAKLFEAIKEEAKAEAKAEFEKEIEPLKNKVTVREQADNMRAFAKSIDEFSKSELAELTPEVEAKLNDLFEDRATLEDAIKQDPTLFERIKKEVLSENFLKAAELVNKKKSVNSKQREKDIKNAKVVTKSKSSSDSKNYEDLNEFKKLPLEKMRQLLPKAEE